MENKEIASVFKLVGQMMDLHGENKFKARSYANASFQIGRLPEPIREMDPDTFEHIPGIGKNLVPKLQELIQTGQMTYLTDWLEKTPEGVLEILKIKGLGPSKVRLIWQEMGIESVGELLYACHENRLVDLKGFGEKTQLQVQEAIEFMLQNRDRFLYASIEPLMLEIKQWIGEHYPEALVTETGAMLRRDPIVESLELVVSEDVESFPDTSTNKIDVRFHRTTKGSFEGEVFKRSVEGTVDEGLVPEMRNVPWAKEWKSKYSNEELITDGDLKGCLHNHSTYSDGAHSLEAMAAHLRDLGYGYFGICDHSKTAVYANGLNTARIEQQQAEITALNAQWGPFRILKGIESDILMDGSLDYEEDVLKSFDLIVASVHSVLKMDESTATKRLITAVENPYTKILGHPTGRLLLSRPGYPIDHKKVIDACAANGVAVELNANPMRLDIDYSWIPYCMERGVMVSINPDAHRKEGFDHMRFGVMAARKGGLVKEMTLNALALEDLLAWLQR
ncbi:MAG: DNA polymerase/3'-5' exonuclease PolX [Flavobacteriales bacterium]|nr:DNA polymerase/3'-5' exonuclease PolX [Flavobacteriales bacterium]